MVQTFYSLNSLKYKTFYLIVNFLKSYQQSAVSSQQSAVSHQLKKKSNQVNHLIRLINGSDN